MCKSNINNLYKTLRNLRTEDGLYLASTGPLYQKIWVRDTFYCVLPELKSNPEYYKQTYRKLLDYYINVQNKYKKFTWLINEPHPKEGYRYPHPRMTMDLDEINEEWGFKQIDCFGEFLYGIWLGESNGINIIRGLEDKNIINLIIKMLESIEYWKDPDNGIWEENEEIHASSVGACIAGLKAIKLLKFDIDQKSLDNACNSLNDLLPRESITKDVDLATLSLIYPFNVVDNMIAKDIITNVENKLLREYGVIRYEGDKYYNIANHEAAIRLNRHYDPCECNLIGNEAEWCFGLAFLALSCYQLNDIEKAKYYLKKLEKCENNGNVPELFYSKTNIANDNNPLGWSIAMTILIMEKLNAI